MAKNTSLWPQFPPWHKLVWLLLVFASAQATASDLTGTEGASSAPIGTPYVPPQYTFTARFPQPSTDLQTARLEGLDSAGRVVADLGPLYDDGTHGDEVAGDGIYQLVREVSMAASIARYRASIGLSNATRRVSASTLSVKINIAPSADAGRDRAAAVGLPLSLDGRNSRDPELQPLDFRWELSERPPESQASLDEPARVAPNFTPDVAGDYRFTLIVNDGRMDSLPALLHIHAAEPDAAPNADAGRNQAVRAGASVRLDGSASRDPENLPLSYLWTLTDKPVGSTAQLLDAHGPQPSFTADLRGLYRARLDVRDAIQAGTPATVVVAAYGGNTPPTAVAGSDQTVRTGTLVQLDGSASFDPDPDDAVSAWTWRLVAQPAGSKVSLGNAKRPNARFTATHPGDYLLELQVTDRVGASASARVLIRATSNLPVPVLSSIEPTGSSAGAAALTLDARGANFMNSSKLLFGSSLLGTHYLAADRLQAELPAAMLANPGVFDVRVRTPGGGDSAALPFTIGPPALLLSTLIPPSVEANHDASLVLTGANFGPTARALLGSLPLATTRESANRLVAALPAAAIQNPGAYSVQVFESSGRASNVLILTVTEPPGPQIDAISPAEGEAGTTVTITGSRFGDSAAANRVAFAGTPAQITSAQADRITVLVPQTANSGPLSVSVAGRSASGPSFTVLRAQDASLSASPAQASVYPGAATAIALRLTDQGTRAYTGAMQLAVTGLPAGISARFDTPALSANQTATLTLSAAESAAAGSFPLRVSATGPTSAGSAARTAAASITVLPRPAAGLTGVTGRFIDAGGAPIAGIIVRADLGLTAQNPETRTDAAGNFVLTGLPAGTVTLRFDATPAHPLYPIWPQQVAVTAGRMLAMEDWVLKPPPAAERFSAIQPNSPADQVVTDARFPGLEIRIPAGVSITGWDGVPKTRIAVERLDPGSLPVASPPIKTKSVYQLFFGSAMGGVPSQPIPITLPNDLGLEPGTQTPLWYYDGSPMGGSGEWKQGGTGTVSADGSVIVSDAGSGIPRFCGVCGLPCFQGTQDAAPNPPCPDCEARAQRAGKPITLATGQELETAVDLVVPGEVPIVISRSYNPFDAFAYIANFQQSLGVNWTLNYDVAIMPFTGDHSVRMVQPGNSRIDMGRGGDGRFRSSGNLQYDGAELIKVGGTNPSIIGQLDGGTRPPTVSVEPVTCIGYDGSYYELRQRDGRVLRFDAAPSATRVRIRGGCLYFLTEIRDPQSRYLRIVRGGDGKISRIETSSGQSASFSYGAGGVVSSITDQSGRSVQYQHARVDALGGFRGFGAETVGGGSQTRAVEVAAVGAGISPLAPYRMVSASTPAGTYAYTYEDDPPNLRLGGLSFVDTLASSSSAVSAAAPTCANVRGGARIKTIQLPGVDGVFTNYYGPSKRVLRQTWPDGTDLRFNYKIVGGCVPGLRSADAGSGNGNELASGSTNGTCRGAGCPRIDSWEGQSVTGGDIVGTEVLDSRGNKISQDFNGSGLATQATDANGQPVTYTRDAQNRITRTSDALGRTTVYAYDERGNRNALTDPAGRRTDIDYHATWNAPISISRRQDDGSLQTWRYQYDQASGNLTQSTDPLGNITRYDYDTNRRLARVTDPLGHSTRFEYDARGNVNRITDALGHTSEFETDAAGNTTRVTDPLGHTTRTDYDNQNRPIRSTDALAGLTQLQYDAKNRLSAVIDPLNHPVERYAYDTIGRLTSLTDAAGAASTYAYDETGKLATYTDRRGQATSLEYDPAGRPTKLSYADGTTSTRAYDAVGRLIDIESADSREQYDYDTLDRLLRVTSTSPAGSTRTDYQYDALDRRTRRSVSYPGGTLETTRYQYDAANRLTRIEQDGPTGTLSVTYTWDGAGRLTEKRLPNGLRQRYTWDAANQLTRIEYLKTDGTQLASLAYDYDGAGRRIRKSGNLPSAPETPIEADYDTANRMTRITLNPGTQAAATYDLSYNPQGSLTQKQNRADPADTTTYTWDARNRLAAVTASRAGNTSSASFRYDALGRRMERTVQTGAETHTTRYVYDGPQAIGELYDGRLAATNLTGLAIDEAIARTVNIETASSANPIRTKTLITDALGSVLAQTGADQTAEIWYAYSPYGETQRTGSDPDSPQNPSQYTGRENDGTIGGTGGGQMYYYRARFYDPVGKRFRSEDPVGLAGGINTYTYVDGNPLSWTDALGLSKGGKKNLGTEGFNKNSAPKDVEDKMNEARRNGQSERYKALRALLKVIKRGGTMGVIWGVCEEYQRCTVDPCSCDPNSSACLIQTVVVPPDA